MTGLAWPFVKKPRTAPAVRPGTRTYAIGDIHGRSDLLMRLHDAIAREIAAAPRGLTIQVVYLGDYIDRGPDSRGVLQLLTHAPLRGTDSVFLLGNHERGLLQFLEKPETGASWLYYGGDAMLTSYGIAVDPMAPRSTDRLTALATALKAALPPDHLAFLHRLKLKHENGDYLFVHAGIDPKRPLERQDEQALLWIREPFTTSSRSFGKVVVHGHSITTAPIVRPNRIGIDTGAYVSGRLTCLVLECDRQRFLST